MSRRTRATEPSALVPATMWNQMPSAANTSRLPNERSQRLSMASNSSADRRSSASLDYSTPSSRPSAIPRPMKKPSNMKTDKSSTSRPSGNHAYRSKAVPNTTAATNRTAMRTRSREVTVPTNSTPRIVTDEDLVSLEPMLPAFDMDHDTVFGVPIPQKRPLRTTDLPPRLIPELQALAGIPHRRPTTAMSTISTISSPSTQFTASPSPWSASTTATTPTSWSSASPSILQPMRSQAISKRSQTVPIPSAVRTTMPKLPALQETILNSAMISKVPVQAEETSTPKKIKKKTPRTSPTPPPRTSSVTRGRSRSNSKNEERIVTEIPPLPLEPDISPIERHVKEAAGRSEQKSRILTDHHLKLQNAINFSAHRPSRNDGLGPSPQVPQHTRSVYTKYIEPNSKLLDAAPIKAPPSSTSQASLALTRPSEPESETEQSVPPQTPRSRLAKFSKLAFFGRSPKKTSQDSDLLPQSRKLQRRGPSAGTGHEAYGKFGRRDRKTSSDGNNTGTDSESSVVSTYRKPLRSASQGERSNSSHRDRRSQSDLDEFTAARLKPVVIVGGSLKGKEIRQSDKASTKKVEEVQDDIKEDLNQTESARHISVTSSGPLLRESRLIFHLDSLGDQPQSQLALRRSQKFEKAEQFRIPQPIITDVPASQPYLSGYNTSQSSIAPTSAAITDASGDLPRTTSNMQEQSRKKGRKFNWGFFKKKEFTPETYQPRTSSRVAAPSMPVRISAVPPPRPMPYYAMLESDDGSTDAEALNDVLAEVAQSTMTMKDEEIQTPPMEELEHQSTLLERPNSILLPFAPLRRQHGAPAQIWDPTSMRTQDRPNLLAPSQSDTIPRRPRLPQVGRIPKVVPTMQPSLPVHVALSSLDQRNDITKSQHNVRKALKQPRKMSLIGDTGPPPILPVSDEIGRKHSNSSFRTGIEGTASSSHAYARDPSRFLDRYSTTSSSSDGAISVMGPPLLPAPEFPTRPVRHTMTEDDVWNEYDDFIDGMISPSRLRKSKARITGNDRIQHFATSLPEHSAERMMSSRRAPKPLAVDTSLALPPLLFAPPRSHEDYNTERGFELRRSRIISALHSSLDPTSPFSIGDYLAELGEARRDSGQTYRLSDSTISPGGMKSPKAIFAFPEPPTTQVEHKHHENILHIDEVERSKDPIRHSEGSYASLMVSRWLSFGRVLFSPAHNDIEKQPGRHVLVIDGLGNEDWSIYCAVTYQAEQAYIYDLKETGHTRSSTSTPKGGQAHPNIRRRELASFNESFKFPDNFFSAIVLRFPPVMAESKLRNIVSECRRVLSPGGYMELVLLDLDMANMGVTTRRAMRNLKTQIAMRNRDVSLKPVIDNFQTILAEKGFAKLSKCIVGVPVVGRPPGADSPTSSRSSGLSDGSRKVSSAGPRPLDGLTKQHRNNISLNDLVADHSENADAKIGRAVSRTARSWWQHCFEAAVISDGNLARSIFADKTVLSECKARASSFKLLIAHTQKPPNPMLGMKRRTMSEPVVTTLATAGTP